MLLSILIIFPSMLLIKKTARHVDTPRVRRDTEREIEGQRERETETESERDRDKARESHSLICEHTRDVDDCGGVCGVGAGGQDGREWSSAS